MYIMHISIYIYIYTCIHSYIYIYIEREREGEIYIVSRAPLLEAPPARMSGSASAVSSGEGSILVIMIVIMKVITTVIVKMIMVLIVMIILLIAGIRASRRVPGTQFRSVAKDLRTGKKEAIAEIRESISQRRRRLETAIVTRSHGDIILRRFAETNGKRACKVIYIYIYIYREREMFYCKHQ